MVQVSGINSMIAIYTIILPLSYVPGTTTAALAVIVPFHIENISLKLMKTHDRRLSRAVSKRRSSIEHSPTKIDDNRTSYYNIISQASKRVRLKLMTIGPPLSGKTTLIKQFCEEKFYAKYSPTIGVDFGMKPFQINGLDIRVDFFDLSGDTAYSDVRNEFFSDEMDGIILVYDKADRKSFECVINFIEEYQQSTNMKETPTILCANKADKVAKVQENEGLALAASKNFTYFEVSSKSGRNVESMFINLLKMSLARMPVK